MAGAGNVGDGDGLNQRDVGPFGLAVGVVGLLAGTALFHALGNGALAPPPLDPAGWGAWVDGRDPLVASVAVLRLLVLALCWYLVGAISIGVFARLLRAGRIIRVADALTIPALRRVVQGALGVSLATAVVTAAVPSPALAGAAAHTASVSAVDDGDAAGPFVPLPAAEDAGDGSALPFGHVDGPRRPLPLQLYDGVVEGRTAGEGAAGEAADGEVAAEHEASVATTHEHVVVAGESFWTIARGHLASVTGGAVSDEAVHRHWLATIDANRDRLADPENPDLIFSGQHLLLHRPGEA